MHQHLRHVTTCFLYTAFTPLLLGEQLVAWSRRTASVGADAAAPSRWSRIAAQRLFDVLQRATDKPLPMITMEAIIVEAAKEFAVSPSPAAEIVAQMAREAGTASVVYGVAGWNSFYQGWIAYILGAVRESDDPLWLDGWDMASETRQPELALRDEIKAGHVIVSLPVADALP